MSRLLLAAFTLFAVIGLTDLHAQGYRYRSGWRHSGMWQQPADWGYPRGTTGYRYGYLYDPYASGSFRAPDLMDDPSFRAKQRVGRLFYSEPALTPRHHQHVHPHSNHRVPTYHSH
ncbi:hypothetical protein [Roseimaritima ulvae]|uniref:Uncharacterized protein n=1 Tax=Roseimaritima ulvae TaxID=980254 RepID=A0A5B9R7E3_9BACT|nr:hypothetical protein [Roseimaritima ulvae]QEG42601.1 hypothetical protein UC8_46430 [Roseimaritima ulvae]